MSSQKSLFIHQYGTNVMSSGNDSRLDNDFLHLHKSTFPMMLKLIKGSILESGNVGTNVDNDNISACSDMSPFPTIVGIANKAAKESGNRLDEKQMIVYETICATFLLGLVNKGRDETMALGQYFAQVLQRKPTSSNSHSDNESSHHSDFNSDDMSRSQCMCH